MKHYKIVNRTRFALSIIVMIIINTMITISVISNNKVDIIDYEYYYVSTGETLWNIASNINTKKDIRKVVYDIKEMNIWDNEPIIHEGDIISIPVYNK